MLASAYSWVSFPGVVYTLIGLMGVAALLRVYWKGSTGQALIDQQDKAISVLKTLVDEQDKKLQQLSAQNEQQADQIRVLTEMVTQTAKVDNLRDLVRYGFRELGVKVPE